MAGSRQSHCPGSGCPLPASSLPPSAALCDSSNLLQLCGEGLNLLFVRLFALVGLFCEWKGSFTPVETGRGGTSYLLLGDLEGLEVVSDDPQLLLQLHDLGLAGLGPLLRALQVGLNHGQLAGDLRAQRE